MKNATKIIATAAILGLPSLAKAAVVMSQEKEGGVSVHSTLTAVSLIGEVDQVDIELGLAGIALSGVSASRMAVSVSGKEVGVQFINGTIESSPIESKIHTQGTTLATAVFDNKATVSIGNSGIVIDFGEVANPIVFSSEAFSGLRFYDVSELDFLDNDPSVALSSLLGSSLNRDSGKTDVQEAGGAQFDISRVVVDDNNIYVNFSGLTISQATGTKVVISLGEPVPESSSGLLLGLTVLGYVLRRKRCF